MFVQKTLNVRFVADYLNDLVSDGWKIVNYTLKDDSRTLGVVHVIVEVEKVEEK